MKTTDGDVGYDPGFTGGDDNDEPVIVYKAAPVAPAKRRLRLLVFFHGGGGTPARSSQFMQRAAQAGYDVVGIDHHGWDGEEEWQPHKCGCDTHCYGQWFERQWQGGSGPGMPSVPESSSVHSRLYKILTFYKKDPDYRWSDYFDAQGHIDWNKLVLVGHSQGTGLATYIAKFRSVDKVILFSGLQWTMANCPKDHDIPPAWMTDTATWATSNNRFWAFMDTQEDGYLKFVTTLKSAHLALDKLHNRSMKLLSCTERPLECAERAFPLPDEFTLYGPQGKDKAQLKRLRISNPCNDFNGYHAIEASDLCNCEPAENDKCSAHNATLGNDQCTGDGLAYRYHIWDYLLAAGSR